MTTPRLVTVPPTTPPKFSALSDGAVSGSVVSFAVRCIKVQKSCRGSILLDASTRVLSGVRSGTTSRVGQAAFTGKPGGVATVRIRLSAKALAALRKAHRLPIVATITVRDASAKTTKTMRLTLKPRPTKPARKP
jgi:hypothetical protein